MVGFCDNYQFYTLINTLLIIENYQMRRWVAWIWWICHRISRAWISWRRVTRRHWHLFQKENDTLKTITKFNLSRIITSNHTWGFNPGVAPRFCKNASVFFFQVSSSDLREPESYSRLRDLPSGLLDLERDRLDRPGAGPSPGGNISSLFVRSIVDGGGGKSPE